jgi:hypothetical protein
MLKNESVKLTKKISRKLSRGSRSGLSRSRGSRSGLSRSRGSRSGLSRSRGSRSGFSRSRGSRSGFSRSRGSRSGLKKSIHTLKTKTNPSKTGEWNRRNSICPKAPSHQLTVNRTGQNWIKIKIKDIKVKNNKFIIKKLNKLPGVYVMIILKENPNIIYLLREFTDLYFNNSIEYPEAPVDNGMIGHSSIYNDTEFSIEWMKEDAARKFELQASQIKNKKTKRKLLRSARKTREQCLLYFAGQLYYDKQIVVWTNHSGHFQPPENVKHKVGLPLEKFAPMSSPIIKKLIEQRYS